jgi:mono/diheme cytochrome c family protein
MVRESLHSMMKNSHSFLLAIFVPVCSLVAYSPEPTTRPIYKSPFGLAVNHDGSRAYVALATAGAIAEVDLQKGNVVRELAVGAGPHDVALAGRWLYVTCTNDDTLVQIDPRRWSVSAKWHTGQAPCGLAVLPEGRVFVACRDEPSLWAFDGQSGKGHPGSLPGWPVRVIVHQGQGTDPGLLVLAKSEDNALLCQVAAELPPRVLRTIVLKDVSNPRGLARKELTLANQPFVVVHQKPRTHVPATQVLQGWVFTNAISIWNYPAEGAPQSGWRTNLLDEVTRAHADPSDVATTPLDHFVFVACAGSDEVLALRTNRLHGGDYPPAAGADHKLTSSRHYLVARFTTGSNPRRLALSGNHKILVASNYLGDSLTVIDVEQLRLVRHIRLGGPEPDAARRGEILFHSARLTFQGQFTCASCHPAGMADGLNWDLSRDGIGNFMNTRSLLGVGDTAPYGWLGTSPTLDDRIAGTLRTLHRHEPQDSEVADIAAYLRTLEAPRPAALSPKDRAAFTRGQSIFEGKGKCAACHKPRTFQDGLTHDVGTRVPGDVQDRFDTPSLRGVYRTAPYLHHGQAKTLAEIFSKYNSRQKHGAAHRLTAADVADLIIYLRHL